MSRPSRPLVALLAAATIALSLAPAASAATTNVTGTVSAGSLSLTAPATAGFAVALDGTDQTGTYSLPLTLTDARGGGLGWNTTITSTQFTSGANTLPTGASSITGVTTACLSTCTAPTNAIAYPLAVPAAPAAPAAVKFFNAAASSGMGKFTLTPSVNVAVPASSFAGSYASTVTIASISGP